MARPRLSPVGGALDRGRIVAAGLKVLEEEGLEKLTLRRIANKLEVKAPALYWHVKSRNALLGFMAEALFRDLLDTLDPRLQGPAFLLKLGHAISYQQTHRRDVARLIAACQPSAEGYAQVQSRVTSRLAHGGIADPSGALMAVFAYTLGWSLFITNADMNSHLAKAMNPDRAFDAGLRAIVLGFADGRPIEGES